MFSRSSNRNYPSFVYIGAGSNLPRSFPEELLGPHWEVLLSKRHISGNRGRVFAYVGGHGNPAGACVFGYLSIAGWCVMISEFGRAAPGFVTCSGPTVNCRDRRPRSYLWRLAVVNSLRKNDQWWPLKIVGPVSDSPCCRSFTMSTRTLLGKVDVNSSQHALFFSF